MLKNASNCKTRIDFKGRFYIKARKSFSMDNFSSTNINFCRCIALYNK